jgi:hypothetical protein
MSTNPPPLQEWGPDTFRFYRDALAVLRRSGVPFLIGGAYALAAYTGIVRHTKDLDVFVRPPDAPRVLEAMAQAGYRTEVTFPHWLSKAFHGYDFVDVIHSSGNGQCPVDDGWFEHGVDAEVLGVKLQLIPPEEMIWQKAYIMERERFDGADVLHLLRVRGRSLDWDRLLARFGPHWRLLLSHLVLFGFVYPGEYEAVPEGLLRELAERLVRERPAPPPEGVCGGPLLSRVQYLPDTEEWGYTDARLYSQGGRMTAEQVERWTDAGR